MRTQRRLWLVMLASITAACGRSDRQASDQDTLAAYDSTGRSLTVDTAGGSVASPSTASPTTVAEARGIEHWRNLDPPRAPARDAGHTFLRSMADHNEGLVQLAKYAVDRWTDTSTVGDARRVHERHVRLRTELIQMIQSRYQETLVPVPSESHEQRMDSLDLTKAEAFGREFFQRASEHHRGWIRRIDELSPRLANSELKAFATRLRIELQRELETFQRAVTSE